MVYLSACFAVERRWLADLKPGTLVGMGLNSPRISLGASGFMSKVSRCDGPPLSQDQDAGDLRLSGSRAEHFVQRYAQRPERAQTQQVAASEQISCGCSLS